MKKALSIRLPEELYAQVKARAEASNRSLNAQIVTELERPQPEDHVHAPVEIVLSPAQAEKLELGRTFEERS